jgi:hypothetical protein
MMHSQIVGLQTSAAIFGIMCLAQLVRLLVRPDVLVAGHAVPLWPSAVAAIVLGSLSVWLLMLARRGR